MNKVIICFLVGLLATAAGAELLLNSVFSDGLVLQRDMPLKVWGTGDVGRRVSVSFAGDEAETSVDGSGNWRVTLQSKPASSRPESLVVTCGREKVVVSDVVVGDVWLFSGQSNMGFRLDKCLDGPADAAKASDKMLRVNSYRDEHWSACIGEAAGNTSGVAYYFGTKIREADPAVPVGLLVRALSGSPIEAWTPVEALKGIDFSRELIERIDTDSEEGKAWLAYEIAEDDFKRARRNGEQKGKVKRPSLGWDSDTKVLAGIYTGENPGRLWRERVLPVAGFAISGMVWYQGERNSKGGEELASEYVNHLTALADTWRSEWGQGDFRFLAVQLPTFEKGGPNWTIVQNCQAEAIGKLRNAAYVDIRDLPDGGLHPKNKRPVGERLAAKARP